jgi:hypothetical protein
MLPLQTLFAAWQSSALSSSYLQKTLSQLSLRMSQIEAEELTPPGWRATWDRYETTSLRPLFSVARPPAACS